MRRSCLFAVVWLGMAIVAGAEDPPGDFAIYPADRYFKPEDLMSALADRQAVSRSVYTDLVQNLMQNPEQLEMLAKLAAKATKMLPNQKEPILDPSKVSPQLRELGKRIFEDPELQQQFLKDPEFMKAVLRVAQSMQSTMPELNGLGNAPEIPSPPRRGGEPVPPAEVDDMLKKLAPQASDLLGPRFSKPDRPGGTNKGNAGGDLSELFNPARRRGGSGAPGQGTDDGRFGGLDRDATSGGNGPTDDKYSQAARWLRDHAGPLAQSDAVREAISKLEGGRRQQISRSSTGASSWWPFGGLGPRTSNGEPALASLGGIKEQADRVMQWSREAGASVKGILPPLPKLPSLPKVNLPSVPLPSVSMPRFGMVHWPSVSASSASALVGPLVAVAVFVVVLVGMALGWSAFGGRVKRMARKVRRNATATELLSDRERICKLFEELAVAIVGESARTQNHRQLARRLGSGTGDVERTAASLADAYEVARYTPPEEPIDPTLLQVSLQHVDTLAQLRPL